MKIKYIVCALLMALSISTAKADGERERVKAGIAAVERMIEAHEWQEAFTKLRQVENTDARTDALRYLTAKQRYQMYDRLRKPADAADALANMENYARQSGDAATIEDMLVTQGDYFYRQGNADKAKACYQRLFEQRAQGKDDAGRDECFKTMIAEARSHSYSGMEMVLEGLYRVWQDSISAIRSEQELALLRDSCATAQTEIADKKSTISHQYTFIIILALIIAAAAAGLVFLFLALVRGRSKNSKLTTLLNQSQTNSEQKSVFIRNIGKQIAPSLTQIAAGNTREHVASLQNLLADVEHFLAIEEDHETSYEPVGCDVSKFCEEVCAAYAQARVSVMTDATKLEFPVNQDGVKRVLTGLIDEALATTGTERIVLSFKKRNPHTGQFIVTANGMHLSEDDPASLFVPFARVYDLTVTTGLKLPICAMVASKMNGTITVDTTFTKGARFEITINHQIK